MNVKPPRAPQSIMNSPAAERYFKDLEKFLFSLSGQTDPPDGYMFSSPNKSVYVIRFRDDGSAYTELVQGADGSGTGTINVTP